ncbi:alkylresorcinol/alkylpyrone synthase [Salinibacillus kushneri]|uniref:Alkylresorcinol/alkylpyrone synthase n=1 Tax=Salinibacillus kushneri TaxID=237682 RepID=A0A1I0DH97_9BACI|nr:3-oxoacyl-[acyl-carrier-protein] synthase III C-terminal domain-containing protein [Salinibacillus kushneri]SET31765.1 alkylresorcinol/alkylpyrone synthase [Salinibacillus kushneri]
MSTIASIGIGIPKYKLTQKDAKDFIRMISHRSSQHIERLLPVFDHAAIQDRQLVVPVDWLKEDHSFEERNQLYMEKAIIYIKQAIEDCLNHSFFLEQSVHTENIDCIIFVSSTGIATPTIDAFIMNELPFTENVTRIPIWGLGCAGGASGIARASEYLRAHPDENVLLLNIEFSSLSFQKNDKRKSNFIGSALFGDGVSCVLMIGEESELRINLKQTAPKVINSSSKIKKDELDVMGWDIRNSGFHVIFGKSIPKLVESFWGKHLREFLHKHHLNINDFPFLIAHPGGKKVLEAMEKVLNVSKELFNFSYKVLQNHGNMSSPTVIYVLKEVMESAPEENTKSIVSALGPGFSSELVLLEWKNQ